MSKGSTVVPAKPANTSVGGSLPFHTLFASAIADKDREDDNAQSILEEHVSRVWDSSNGQTPSRSPGAHSPERPGRPSRGGGQPHYPTPNTSSSLLHTSFGSSNKPHFYRRKDLSNSSYDSGMGVEERTGVYYEGEVSHHKHIFHHHHHHHHINPVSGSSNKDSAKAARLGPSPYGPQTGQPEDLSSSRLNRSLQHYPSSSSTSAQRSSDADRSRSKDAKRSSKESKGSKGRADLSNSFLESLHYHSDHMASLGVAPNLHDPNSEK